MSNPDLQDTEADIEPETKSAPRWMNSGWRPSPSWFVAEIIVVVVGILIAVVLNAWWTGREAHKKEQIVLQDLRQDFATNQDEIQRVQTAHALHQQRFGAFESLGNAEIDALPLDSIRAIYGSLLLPNTFDPVRGTIDALVASGDLGLLSDQSLRNNLTSFLGLVDDAAEERGALTNSVISAVDRLSALGGPWEIPGVSDSLGPTELKQIRRDDLFVGRARIVRGVGLEYVSELERIAPVIDSILVRTERNLYR